MAMHVVAYSASVANTANIEIAPLSDDIVNIQNAHFIFQQDVQLLWAALMSVTISRGRLNSPSMRQIAQKYIRPVIAAVIPGNNPNVDLQYNNPFTLKGQEEIAAEVTHANAMAERVTLIMGVANRVQAAPKGPVFPLRWTSTTAAVANAWTTLAVTFETALPVGTYAVIASEHQSTNGQAHRLLFDNQPERPGYLSYSALTQRNAFETYQAPFGQWGQFRTISLPRVQVLCNGADAAHEGYIHAVKLSGL